MYRSQSSSRTFQQDLWKLCDRHGVVADVYIARKLSKSGRRFGFVRFIKNPDQVTLLEDLNKIWIGSYHLFASVARFDRKHNKQMKQPNKKQSIPTKSRDTSHSIHTMEGRSFASVLNGKEGAQKTTSVGSITKRITLENSDLLELSDTSSIVLAKKNKEMEWYFTQRKFVSHNFIPDERMIWIEIEGLPLNARTVNAFKRIASNWGETVFVDEDADENIASGRSGASYNDIHDINELQEEEGEINDKEEPFGHQINAPGSTRARERAERVKTTSPSVLLTYGDHVVDDRQKQTSTNSPSKPPGFEGFNIQETQKIQSQGKTSRVCPSNASSQSVRPSHTKRSQSKMGQSTGSMIDNFLRHINMGNAPWFTGGSPESSLSARISRQHGVKHGLVEDSYIGGACRNQQSVLLLMFAEHHCRVRPYTREVLVLSTNLEIQTKHYSLVFRNRRGDEARIKKTWYNQVRIADYISTFKLSG
ncbi:RNA-directed DNA polymerase, eukaryota [Tanacetum coccineum]